MMFCLFHVDADVLLVMSSRGKADTSDKLTLIHKGILMLVVVEEEDEISPHLLIKKHCFKQENSSLSAIYTSKRHQPGRHGDH